MLSGYGGGGRCVARRRKWTITCGDQCELGDAIYDEPRTARIEVIDTIAKVRRQLIYVESVTIVRNHLQHGSEVAGDVLNDVFHLSREGSRRSRCHTKRPENNETRRLQSIIYIICSEIFI